MRNHPIGIEGEVCSSAHTKSRDEVVNQTWTRATEGICLHRIWCHRVKIRQIDKMVRKTSRAFAKWKCFKSVFRLQVFLGGCDVNHKTCNHFVSASGVVEIGMGSKYVTRQKLSRIWTGKTIFLAFLRSIGSSAAFGMRPVASKFRCRIYSAYLWPFSSLQTLVKSGLIGACSISHTFWLRQAACLSRRSHGQYACAWKGMDVVIYLEGVADHVRSFVSSISMFAWGAFET